MVGREGGKEEAEKGDHAEESCEEEKSACHVARRMRRLGLAQVVEGRR
jgi:hypothetical protein